MIKRATAAEWEAYYQMQDQRSDFIERDIYQRELRRKERWERVMFLAFGAYLIGISVAFVALR